MRVWPQRGPLCLSVRKAPTFIICVSKARTPSIGTSTPASRPPSRPLSSDWPIAAAWRRPTIRAVSALFHNRPRPAILERKRYLGEMVGLILAAALVLSLLGCAPDAELAARQAAEPDAIAAAVCREVRTEAAGECENVRLADRASEIAYAACLDYNRRNLRACGRLRQAYENDIRAQLATPKPPVVETSLSEKRRALDGLQAGERYRTAEALYKAANSDADTFQAALLIPEVRKKIEAALGKHLSDAQLSALVENNRAEAVYWYGYAQNLRPARENAEEKPGG